MLNSNHFLIISYENLIPTPLFLHSSLAWSPPFCQETESRSPAPAPRCLCGQQRNLWLLDATYGAGRFEVGNFGRSGATLLNRGHRPYMQQPEFRRAMDFKADWVVIHLGLNDTDPRDWPDWKEDFIPDYRALIDSFLVANPEARVLICLMTPIFDRHARFQSGTRDWHAQIQAAIRKVAGGANVQLIDLNTPLHSRPDLFPDALHPNPEGAQILARTVYGALTGDYGGLRLPPVYSIGMVLPRD